MSNNFITEHKCEHKDLFNMLLIGVEDSYAGAGVSFDLIRNSACLAKQLGYKYFVA
jgi:hypothetical protein